MRTQSALTLDSGAKQLENYTKNNESLQRVVLTSDRPTVNGRKQMKVDTHLSDSASVYAVEVSFTSISRQMSKANQHRPDAVSDGNHARMLMANLQSQILDRPEQALQAQGNVAPQTVLRLL